MNTLASTFASRSRARKMKICQQLSMMKKQDLSTSAYFCKMKSLAAIGTVLDDDEFISYVLYGLRPDWLGICYFHL